MEPTSVPKKKKRRGQPSKFETVDNIRDGVVVSPAVNQMLRKALANS
jgi:hypothetical protein